MPILGATFTALFGLFLWATPFGEAWENASYDYLFRFGSRSFTNQIVLISMDNEAYYQLHQARDQLWDRKLHTKLVNRLADDGCSLAVFDIFFKDSGAFETDQAMIQALGRLPKVVLMAEQAEISHPTLNGVHAILPFGPFLQVARTNWGIGWLNPNLDSIMRHHWPFPAPGPCPSLPWTAALLAGAHLSDIPQEQYLRYYGPNGAWESLSYRFALTQPIGYFRNKVVFVGNKPMTTIVDDEKDKFQTPYTRWSGEISSGMEIQATAFLNLLNGDWLRRPKWWMEALVLTLTGALLGAWLCMVGFSRTCLLAVAIIITVTLGSVLFSYITNYWFPWLVIAGGQLPCAFIWAFLTAKIYDPIKLPLRGLPITPGYELIHPPFAEGAYGSVCLARNAVGEWQALKIVYRARFSQDDPYEREFNGVKKYKPISDKHSGLLRVDFVSQKEPAGFFYYVMELGDALDPAWKENPTLYRPGDLASIRAQAKGRRLDVKDCLRIGIALTEALHFLHQQGLTHRDIKPQNIIFVNGQPKLADIGLVTGFRAPGKEPTMVGTPGYMPPTPEPPGTVQADIYGLGMVLYVIRTGSHPAHFPEVSTTLVENSEMGDFAPFNEIILKACEPDRELRYASAAEMRGALTEVQRQIDAL